MTDAGAPDVPAEETNAYSWSTTFEWRRVKIRRPPEASKRSAPKAHRWFSLPPRDARTPLTIKVKFRGGAECWYEVHARGQIGRFTGVTALHDVMQEINRVQ